MRAALIRLVNLLLTSVNDIVEPRSAAEFESPAIVFCLRRIIGPSSSDSELGSELFFGDSLDDSSSGFKSHDESDSYPPAIGLDF